MNFYNNVSFTGNVSVNVNDRHNKIRVQGDVDLTNIGATELEEVETTGSIIANSNSHFSYLNPMTISNLDKGLRLIQRMH